MKQYGYNKATEFTKKQINVIWSKAKNGELKVEKWFLKELYNLAEYYGEDFSGEITRREQRVLFILKAIFDCDIENAQNIICDTTEEWFNVLTKKYQAKIDRNEFVN